VTGPSVIDGPPTTLAEALVRMAEAEDTLRAIGAGEVDAFIVSDGDGGRHLFALSTADRTYRMFVENMRDGAATLSSSGLILYANRRLAELLSCPTDTIVGTPLAAFVAGGVTISSQETAGPGGLGATIEVDLVDGDGVAVPVLVGISPLEVDGDHLSCLTFTDLRAQKAQDREIARLGHAESERTANRRVADLATRVSAGEREQERLRRSEERLFQFLDGVPVGLFVLDATGKAVYANDSAHVVLGYGVEGAPDGRNVLTNAWVPNTATPFPFEDLPMPRALAGDHTAVEIDFDRAGGQRRRIRIIGTPIVDEDGSVAFGLVGMVDVTDEWAARHQLEQQAVELVRSNAKLASSNADLERFAYVASHDLQEPLRMVGSYVQLLARRYRGQLDADADDFIGYAVEGATRMQSLINDLLAYSRLGRQHQEVGPVDTGAVVARVVDDLRDALTETGGAIRTEALPSVSGDGSQIEQVFRHLLANALKFRGPGPSVIEIAARAEGDEWWFSVTDNGIGIEAEYAELVFIMFQRLNHRGTYAGNGIGLAICRRIVERHGGRIWHEPGPGGGSRFCFTIPADPSHRQGTRPAPDHHDAERAHDVP
jgi:PAS domain S-box-containing protein